MLKKETKNSESFKEMLNEAKIKCKEGKYVFIKSVSKYYWIEKRNFYSQSEIMVNLMFEKQILEGLREDRYIIDYDGICYLEGGKKNHYNLFDRKKLLLASENPKYNKHIKELIDNVCGNKKENIEWLLKAILYKYTHINDFTLSAVIFYGAGGSGKGSFVKLMSTIFGEDNTLANLGQRDLMGNFDTYTGNKLIVEFAELSTNNTNSDYKILNKLKNIVGAEMITVNQKGVKQYQTNNIAWFFISSNSNKPLQLDDKDKGNRRFTVIRSYKKLENGKEINDIITNKEIVADFLMYLIDRYPEVIKMTSLEALDNEDKRDLEDLGNSETNKFWDWFEEMFPEHEANISKKNIEDLLGDYCLENNLNFNEIIKYFWQNSKYSNKRIRLNGKLEYGVIIPKKSK